MRAFGLEQSRTSQMASKKANDAVYLHKCLAIDLNLLLIYVQSS